MTLNDKELLEVTDFGAVLKQLRENAGLSRSSLGDKIGRGTKSIQSIEESRSELPDELHLTRWLRIIGCKDNIKKLLDISRQFRLSQSIRLRRSEPANPDIVRLIQYYKYDKLTAHDRALLRCVCRHPLKDDR